VHKIRQPPVDVALFEMDSSQSTIRLRSGLQHFKGAYRRRLRGPSV